MGLHEKKLEYESWAKRKLEKGKEGEKRDKGKKVKGAAAQDRRQKVWLMGPASLTNSTTTVGARWEFACAEESQREGKNGITFKKGFLKSGQKKEQVCANRGRK